MRMRGGLEIPAVPHAGNIALLGWESMLVLAPLSFQGLWFPSTGNRMEGRVGFETYSLTTHLDQVHPVESRAQSVFGDGLAKRNKT